MKYIVLARDLASGRRQELPFIFPEDVPHAEMLSLLNHLSWNAGVRVVAAGEVTFDEPPRCSGRSHSLDRASRGQVDADLIRSHAFRHGIVDHD